MAKFLDSTGVTQLVQQLDTRYKPMSYNPPVVTLATLGVTATAAELNKLDGATVTVAEINHLDGVTGPIQTQINTLTSEKQNKLAAGVGISINGSNVISCTLDTTIYKVVEELPERPASGDTNKIHLVPDDNGSGQNVYLEYIWQGEKWELLGQSSASTEIAIDNITGLGSNWLAALKAAKPNWSLVGHDHTLADITDLNAGWDAVLKAAPAFASATHEHTGAQVTLAGYVLGAASAVAATDTVNAAFGKVQASLNAKVPASRTINNKPLSNNVTLAGGDIKVGGTSAYASNDIATAIGALDEKIDGLDIPSITGLLTNVTASGSGKLTLNAFKTGTTVAITGSIGAYAINDISGLQAALNDKADTDDLSNYVPTTRTINGLSLSENRVLDGGDIALTGYAKGTASTPIAATDTVNAAIAKLENKIGNIEADIPEIPEIPDVSINGGDAESGKYIRSLVASGHVITVTKASLPTRAASMTVACTSGTNTSTSVNLSGSTATLTIGVMSESDIEAAIEAATA